MTGQRGFTSVFAAELDAYVTFKQNVGFTGASRVWYLRRFDAYCSKHELTVFDQDTVEGWVTSTGAQARSGSCSRRRGTR